MTLRFLLEVATSTSQVSKIETDRPNKFLRFVVSSSELRSIIPSSVGIEEDTVVVEAGVGAACTGLLTERR